MDNRVVFDCERMKYPFTGLYYYCLHLGKALLQQPHDEELCFFVPPSAKGVFGDDAHYLLQHPAHKLRLPSAVGKAVWHAAHQSTDYYPSGKKNPVVLTVHDLNFLYDEAKRPWRKKAYLDSLQKKMDKADVITCISQFAKAEILQHLDAGGKPVEVIYNGCNIEPLDVEPPTVLPGAPFLLAVGVCVPKKNVHVLPALLRGNDWRLVIAGITPDADYKKLILEEAQRHGVEERVVFTGAVSENDKQWYYRHCLAFVFPSLSEGFGLTAVEAMYFGKPVFLSARTSLPEIGGDAAYYFQSFDPDAMRETVAAGLRHYEEAAPQESIKQRAAQFSWQAAAAKYWDVYRQLL